jgi:nickel/cobalt exporter
MRHVLAALVCLAAALLAAPAGADDPFRTGKPAEPATVTAPTVAGGFLLRLGRMQAEINETLSKRIHELKEAPSATMLAGALGLAFLYGVLHAAGPGHGKTVVASYFVARRRHWTAGIVLGGLISLIQGISAIAIVAVLGIVLRYAGLDVLGQTTLVEAVSYGLIALIGGTMLVQALRGAEHHHHHHGPGDHHHHGTSGTLMALAAGLTPCASAVIVMLFALANDAFAIGAEVALAMSVGMGLTVAAVGVLSIAARDLAERLAASGGARAVLVERGLNMLGAGLVLTVAGVLFLGAVSRL